MEEIEDNEHWSPISSELEVKALLKKYLPNGQLPGTFNNYPVLVSSLNDWFPIHMAPVIPFSMFFDYQLAQELSPKEALLRETKNNLELYQEGY